MCLSPHQGGHQSGGFHNNVTRAESPGTKRQVFSSKKDGKTPNGSQSKGPGEQVPGALSFPSGGEFAVS